MALFWRGIEGWGTKDLNRFLRGWAGYFRYGNSIVQFDQIVKHADRRLALLLAHRYQRAWW